jgi:hypothetical protein
MLPFSALFQTNMRPNTKLGHSSIEMTRRYARLTDITRKEEYFRAMAKIEKEGVHGDYRCHHQLP